MLQYRHPMGIFGLVRSFSRCRGLKLDGPLGELNLGRRILGFIRLRRQQIILFHQRMDRGIRYDGLQHPFLEESHQTSKSLTVNRINPRQQLKYLFLYMGKRQIIHLLHEAIDMAQESIPLIIGHEADQGLRDIVRGLRFAGFGFRHNFHGGKCIADRQQ